MPSLIIVWNLKAQTYSKLDLIDVICNTIVDLALLHVDSFWITWNENWLGWIYWLHRSAVIYQVLESVFEVISKEGWIDSNEALAQVGFSVVCSIAENEMQSYK